MIESHLFTFAVFFFSIILILYRHLLVKIRKLFRNLIATILYPTRCCSLDHVHYTENSALLS